MMRISFIGTGLMGGLMCERLLQKNYDLTVWNRTKHKTDKLKSLGAEVAASPYDAIKKGDLVITMLSDFNAIMEVFNDITGVLSGKTFLQMSTIAPDESILLKERIESMKADYFEAPVLGGISQIPEGKLIPIVGSSVEQFIKWKSFLGVFGETIEYIGEVGKGAAVKLACNQLIASLVASFSISVGYIRESEIDVEKFMRIIRPSAYYAPAFDKKLPNMISRDFSKTNFPLKHLLKDVNLILNELNIAGIKNTPLEEVKNILTDSVQKGFADEDYSALYNIVHEERNKLL